MNRHKEGIANIHKNIRKLFKIKKKPMKCWEIRDLYMAVYGKRYSESGFSARLREMADIQCNLSDYTYTLGRK